MIPVPVVSPLVTAPTMLVVRIQTRPVRGLRVVLRRSSNAPRLVVTLKARRGRSKAYGLRPATTYTLRARACLKHRCGRWSRLLRVTTLHTAELPRIVSTAPVERTTPLLVGFNDTAYADRDPDGFFADLHALHATIARRIVTWSVLEPDGPTPDYTTPAWRRLDAFVARAQAEGLRVMLEVDRWLPTWARQHPIGSGLGGAPQAWAWRGFVQTIATRYPGIAYFGLSEPDIGSDDARIPLADQVSMTTTAYAALHPLGINVMCCGWTGHEHSSIRSIAAAEKQHGRFFDSISLHIYPSMFGRANGWEPPTGDRYDAWDTADLGTIEAFLRAQFGRRVPWHVTETGWMTPGGYHGDALTPDAQAKAGVRELEAARAADGLESLSWFLVRDQPGTGGNTYKTGLEWPDGSHKPLFDAWAAALNHSEDS